jgi:cytosine/adenosine deaminase-related metal-dependent hydrolase
VTLRVISAPWVLPGRHPERPGEAAPAIADGAVALDEGKVVAVGPREAIERRHGPGERLDAVLLPALVDAHLHLELSHMKGRVAGGAGLPTWIGLFVATRPGTRPGEAEQAMVAAAAELRAAGVAAVGDVSNTLASLEPLARAGLCGTVYHEVLGFTRDRFARYREAARAERGVRPAPRGLRVLESPHAVYSTNREDLWSLLRAGPGSIHLAEHPAEREFCRDGGGPFGHMYSALGAAEIERLRVQGGSPVVAAVEVGGLGPHHLAVHCVDLDDRDLELLARCGATVVLCPRSNQYISQLLPPLPRLLAAGVPLAVGTDSLASCPSLAPLADLAALRREFPEISAARLLPLAWNGAAVGAPHVGRLAPGLGPAPGVLAAPLDGARVEDPFEHLLSAFGVRARPFTWLAPNALEPR